jgi:hypothetical protein
MYRSICDFSPRNTCSVTWSKIAKWWHFARHACINTRENMVNRCAWGTCRNYSQFQHLQTCNKTGNPVTFYCFLVPKCWNRMSSQRHIQSLMCKKDSYLSLTSICSLHFVCENGPTPQHSDPISAITSKEKVYRMYLRVLLWYLTCISEQQVYTYLYIVGWKASL